MKYLKIVLHILAFIIGMGLVIVGQNGSLLENWGVATHSAWNLLLEFIGVAILLVQLYLYNKKYTKYDVKAAKNAKK